MSVGVLVMMMACLSDGQVPGCSVDQRKIITVSDHRKASISCPSVKASSSEIKYLLYFNNSCINEIHLNKKSASAEALFSGQFEVTARKSGMYICESHAIYPPPFAEECLSTEVIVAENPTTSENISVVHQSCPLRSPSILDVVLWAGCGVLFVYSLSISCVTIVLWRKLKTYEEDTCVYANTRPGEIRKPAKV
ncbi:uncharacterized protein AB9X84_013886 isoform 1-T2 [Acanthopagrus schlegelii]